MEPGSAKLFMHANSNGVYGFKCEGDRLGKFAMLSALQLVMKEITDDVHGKLARTEPPMGQPYKSGQNNIDNPTNVEITQEQDYTDGVPMPKHQALQEYWTVMETLRERMISIEKAPDDETFVVPQHLLNETNQ